MDEVIETLEFFVFSYREENSYKGRVVFEIKQDGGGNSEIHVVEVDPHNVGSPVKLLANEKAKQKLEDGVEVNCWVVSDRKEFLGVYSGAIPARKAVLSGKIHVKGWAFRELLNFSSAFDFSTPQWNLFYEFKQQKLHPEVQIKLEQRLALATFHEEEIPENNIQDETDFIRQDLGQIFMDYKVSSVTFQPVSLFRLMTHTFTKSNSALAPLPFSPLPFGLNRLALHFFENRFISRTTSRSSLFHPLFRFEIMVQNPVLYPPLTYSEDLSMSYLLDFEDSTVKHESKSVMEPPSRNSPSLLSRLFTSMFDFMPSQSYLKS